MSYGQCLDRDRPFWPVTLKTSHTAIGYNSNDVLLHADDCRGVKCAALTGLFAQDPHPTETAIQRKTLGPCFRKTACLSWAPSRSWENYLEWCGALIVFALSDELGMCRPRFRATTNDRFDELHRSIAILH